MQPSDVLPSSYASDISVWLSVKIISSKWTDQGKQWDFKVGKYVLCGVCVCIGINVQKGEKYGEISLLLDGVKCDLFLPHCLHCLNCICFHLDKYIFQYDKCFLFFASVINA